MAADRNKAGYHRSVAVVLLLISIWTFVEARIADSRGFTVAFYNRNAPVTPVQLYAISAVAFLIGIGVLIIARLHVRRTTTENRQDRSADDL